MGTNRLYQMVALFLLIHWRDLECSVASHVNVANLRREIRNIPYGPIITYSVQEESVAGYVIGNILSDLEPLLSKWHGERFRGAENIELTFTNLRDDAAQLFVLERSTGFLRITSTPDRDAICPVTGVSVFSLVEEYTKLMAFSTQGSDRDPVLGNVSPEIPCFFDLKLGYRIGGNMTHSVTTEDPKLITIRVEIMDINDHAPMFPQARLDWDINELSATSGMTYLEIPNAYDPDLGRNGTVFYWLQILDTKDQHDSGYSGDRKASAQSSPFKLTSNPLRLQLTKPLDWESQREYKLMVHAQDFGVPQSLTGNLNIHITVRDENDNAPVFSQSEYYVVINESVQRGTTILELTAKDADSPANGQLTFNLAQPLNALERICLRHFGLRTVGSNQAIIYVVQPPDVDQTLSRHMFQGETTQRFPSDIYYQEYSFNVTVRDNGYPRHLSSTARVVIRVLDVNDYVPTITVTCLQKLSANHLRNLGMTDPYAVTSTMVMVRENQDRSFVAFVTVQDRDSGPWGQVHCHPDNDAFTLIPIPTREDSNHDLTLEQTPIDKNVLLPTEKGFKLISTKSFDRELTSEVLFHIICVDNPTMKSATSLNAFNQYPNYRGMSENSEFTTTTIHSVQLTGTILVRAVIIDENDNAPTFKRPQYTFEVNELDGSESTSPGGRFTEELIGEVTATDPDEPSDLSYHLSTGTSDAFYIDSDTGKLYARRRFDRERLLEGENSELLGIHVSISSVDSVQLLLPVTVNDGLHNVSTVVRVLVRDVNDNPPIFENQSYVFSVQENEQPLHRGIIGSVKAQDRDCNSDGQLEYKLADTQETQLFNFNESLDDRSGYSAKLFFAIGGRTGQLHLIRKLDREQFPQHIFHVIAVDAQDGCRLNTGLQPNNHASVKHTATATVTVLVTDVNDNVPHITYPPSHGVINVESGAPAGHNLFTVIAHDPDAGENGTVKFTLRTASFDRVTDGGAREKGNPTVFSESKVFDIDQNTGIVYLVQKLRVKPASHLLIIEAHDLGRPAPRKATSTVTVRVHADTLLTRATTDITEMQSSKLFGEHPVKSEVLGKFDKDYHRRYSKVEGALSTYNNRSAYGSLIADASSRALVPIDQIRRGHLGFLSNRTVVIVLATVFSLLLLTTIALLLLIKRRKTIERQEARVRKNTSKYKSSNNVVNGEFDQVFGTYRMRNGNTDGSQLETAIIDYSSPMEVNAMTSHAASTVRSEYYARHQNSLQPCTLECMGLVAEEDAVGHQEYEELKSTVCCKHASPLAVYQFQIGNKINGIKQGKLHSKKCGSCRSAANFSNPDDLDDKARDLTTVVNRMTEKNFKVNDLEGKRYNEIRMTREGGVVQPEKLPIGTESSSYQSSTSFHPQNENKSSLWRRSGLPNGPAVLIPAETHSTEEATDNAFSFV